MALNNRNLRILFEKTPRTVHLEIAGGTNPM